jgi:DNA-binding transcriptional regulator YdaS (Cro superfamily)
MRPPAEEETGFMGGRQKAFLEHEEVMELLRSEIARAGGQVHWAKMMGVDRSNLNKALHGQTALSKRAIRALKLRVVYAPISDVEAAASVRPTMKRRPDKSVRRRR